METLVIQPRRGSGTGTITTDVSMTSTWTAYTKVTVSGEVTQWYSSTTTEQDARYFSTAEIPVGSTINSATLTSNKSNWGTGSLSSFNMYNSSAETVSIGVGDIVIGQDLRVPFIVKAKASGAYPPHSIGSTTFTNYSKSGKWSDIALTIDYTPPYTACGAPSTSISSATAGKENAVTLSWSGATNGSYNAISGYSIERSSDGTNYSVLQTVNSSSDYGSITVYSPATNNGSYWYRVQTLGSVSGYNSSYSNIVKLTSVWSSVTAPTSVKANNKTALYYGPTSAPNVQISWSGASNGTNNAITKYNIYTNGAFLGESTTTTYTTSAPTTTTTYKVLSVGTGTLGNSGQSSASAVVNVLTSVSGPSFTSTFPATTGGTVSVAWQQTAITGYSFSYTINQVANSQETQIATTSGTTYTFTPTVARGENFQIKIISRANGVDGGYISGGQCTSSIIRYADNFTYPANFWVEHYDSTTTGTVTNKLLTYCYANVKFSWNLPNPSPGSIGIYYWKLQMKEGASGVYNDIAYPNSREYVYSLSQIQEGKTLYFRILARDDFDVELPSPEVEIRKLSRPTITDAKKNSATYNNVQTSFFYGRTSDSSASLTYKLYLLYETTEMLAYTGTITSADVVNPKINNLAINLAGTHAFYTALRAQVITNKITKPTGSFKIELSHSLIPSCLITQIIPLEYNFFREIQSAGTFTKTGTKEYYNPGDTISFSGSGAVWADAAGGNTGATLTYYIEQGSRIININSTGQSGVSFSATDIAISATEDLSLTYTLVETLAYADAVSVKRVAISPTIKIARWTTDTVSVTKVVIDTNKLVASFTLPVGFCGSTQYNNVSGIVIKAFNGTAQVGANYTVPSPFSVEQTNVNFATSLTTGDFSFQIIFTNSSTKGITATTKSYQIIASDATFAIRKNVVGINVPSNFQGGSDVPSLEINSKPGATNAYTAVIKATGTSTKGPSIQFMYGSSEVGSIKLVDGKTAINRAVEANKLTTARLINNVAFDGTQNITIADATKVPLVGGIMSGNLYSPNIKQQNNVLRSNLGDPTVAEMGFIDSSWTNKFDFFPVDKIVVEESSDDVIWTNKTVADAELKKLVGGDGIANIPILKGTFLRLTFEANTITSYVFLSCLYIMHSTAEGTLKLKIEKYNQSSDSWFEVVPYTNEVSGWPGHATLYHNFIPYHYNSSSTYSQKVRVTFSTILSGNANDTNYPYENLNKLQWWGSLSTGTRNLFSTDSDKNAIFPAKVTASSFIGNASSASKLEIARNIAGSGFNGTTSIDISYTNLINKPTLGTLSSLNVAPVANGGTGATTADGARTNLGAIGNYGIQIISSPTSYFGILKLNSTGSETSLGFQKNGANYWALGMGVGGIGESFGLYGPSGTALNISTGGTLSVQSYLNVGGSNNLSGIQLNNLIDLANSGGIGTIEHYGAFADGGYITFRKSGNANFIMQWKNVTITSALTNWNNVYYTDINMGNWYGTMSQGFYVFNGLSQPDGTAVGWAGGLHSANSTFAGIMRIFSATSTAASRTAYALAIGYQV